MFVLTLLVPYLTFSQYYAQNVSEKNFEESQIYFDSYYLNPFGLYSFKDVTPGMLNDPFLNMHINPAIIPDLESKAFRFYIDFRGDREPEQTLDVYPPIPLYGEGSFVPVPVYNYYSGKQYEPEPLLSVGIISHPVKELGKKFYVAGTYQIIRRDEGHYSSPYPTYYRSSEITAPDAREGEMRYYPDYYGYYGRDDMFTEAHLFSFYTGYKFLEKLSVGLGFNAVIHERTTNYINAEDYPYSSDVAIFPSNFYREKMTDYSHLDFNIGVRYDLSPESSIGLKAGFLDGKVNQLNNYEREFDYSYNYDDMDQNINAGYSFNDQKWKRDGGTIYGGFDYKRKIDDDKTVSVYYLYSNIDLDLNNSSLILDSTFYSSSWYDTYQNISYGYNGKSFLSDRRTGMGVKTISRHEASIAFTWKISPSASVVTGIFYKNENDKINTTEPVEIFNKYEYQNTSNGNVLTDQYYEAHEKKQLTWNSNTQYWTLQIPVIFQITFDKYWGIVVGLNKILNTWNISEEIYAHIETRYVNDNGVINEKTDFLETYRQPERKITDDATRVFLGFEINFTESLKNRIMFEPEFENQLRIAQWWLAFSVDL